MPPEHARPANSPKSAARSFWLPAGATLLAFLFFASGLTNEPFADEYAYLTQAYFTDLVLAGKTNDPAWLEFPAYDLPPLPKYLIGLSLHAGRFPLLGPNSAILWYKDINRRFGTPEMLVVARIPSAILGALGCLAVYAIGSLAKDRRTGWIGFFLLLSNPLYGLHARRAMSDVPCEAFVLASLVAGLAAWLFFLRGRWASPASWIMIMLAGGFAGLALLCKFNALLALMTLAAWCILGLTLLIVPRPNINSGLPVKVSLIVGTALSAILAFGVFVALNPFMRTHPSEKLPEDMAVLERMNPWQRFRFQMKHRTDLSEGQQKQFTHNALTTPVEKIKVIGVQGFGRFGPLGKHGWSSAEKTSEQRYEWSQDWGATAWGPLAIAGFVAAFLLGRRQQAAGEVPAGWAILAWGLVTFGVVTIYIPMAWDRYLLPIQGVSCMLVAVLCSLVWDELGRWGSVAIEAEPGVTEA